MFCYKLQAIEKVLTPINHTHARTHTKLRKQGLHSVSHIPIHTPKNNTDTYFFLCNRGLWLSPTLTGTSGLLHSDSQIEGCMMGFFVFLKPTENGLQEFFLHTSSCVCTAQKLTWEIGKISVLSPPDAEPTTSKDDVLSTMYPSRDTYKIHASYKT